jgi:hypothetical protein
MNSSTQATKVQDQGYNGWANYETWNVALWIQNDQSLYSAAVDLLRPRYSDLVALLWECGSKETPDGVKWNSKKINVVEIDEMLKELRD